MTVFEIVAPAASLFVRILIQTTFNTSNRHLTYNIFYLHIPNSELIAKFIIFFA